MTRRSICDCGPPLAVPRRAGPTPAAVPSSSELANALGSSDGGDQRLIAEANFWVAFLRRQRGEVPESSPALRHALERAAQLGEELDDPTAAALPKALMGSFIGFTGDLREGARQMREALDVIEKTGDAVSIAMISDFLAIDYARMGEFKAAEETIERALQFAGDGDAIARVDVDIAQAALDLERGDSDTARREALSCATRAEDMGAYACVVASNVMFGAASLARNDAPGAKAPLERGSELCHVTNMAPMRTLLNGLLGSTRARLGDLPGGIAQWDEALAECSRYGRSLRRGPDAVGSRPEQRPPGEPEPGVGSRRPRPGDRAVRRDGSATRRWLARCTTARSCCRPSAAPTDADGDEHRSNELGRELGLRDMTFA